MNFFNSENGEWLNIVSVAPRLFTNKRGATDAIDRIPAAEHNDFNMGVHLKQFALIQLHVSLLPTKAEHLTSSTSLTLITV